MDTEELYNLRSETSARTSDVWIWIQAYHLYSFNELSWPDKQALPDPDHGLPVYVILKLF